MDKALIKEILEYVEQVEEQIDGEWGSCRSFQQILEDNKNGKHDSLHDTIPDFYFKLKQMLTK